MLGSNARAFGLSGSGARRLGRVALALAMPFLVAVLVALPCERVFAEDEGEGARALGRSLAADGRCEAAIETLAPLRTSPPTDAEAERWTGECAIRLQDFGLARRALEAARALDPATPDVDLHLAMVYFHSGDLEAAAEALDRAEATAAERPEFLLYSGLVAFERADYDSAIGRLGAASRLAGRPVEPMASFFLGRALGQKQQTARAEEAFESVKTGFPDTLWAEQAQRAIDELHADAGFPWWAAFELGFEHDDNALLRGRDVGLPSEISGQSDQRGFWFVDFGALLFDEGGTSGGATLRYGGSKHHDLDQFDTHAPGGTLWLDRDLGIADTSLRLQYDFDVAWIDEDPFVLSHLGTASIYKPWSTGAYSLLGTSVGYDNYLYDRVDVQDARPGPQANACEVCSPPGVNEIEETNRDGLSLRASLLHREPLTALDHEYFAGPYVEGEYSYQRYWSRGREYDHQRHQVALGVGVELPFALQLRVTGRYAYVPYDNRSSFPDPSDIPDPVAGFETAYPLDSDNRVEHEAGVRVVLQRAIGEHVLLRARYSRTDNFSTSDVFQYDRDLFGLSVRVGLGG